MLVGTATSEKSGGGVCGWTRNAKRLHGMCAATPKTFLFRRLQLDLYSNRSWFSRMPILTSHNHLPYIFIFYSMRT